MQPLASTLAALYLTGSLAGAQCPADGFEPNDSCGQAAPLAEGFYPGLANAGGETDTYQVLVPAGWRMQVDVHLVNPGPGLSALMELVQGDGSADPCAVQAATETFQWIGEGTTDFTLGWSAPSTGATNFWIELNGFGSTCMEYDLTLSLFADPCESSPDPGIEDNDDCAGAADILPAPYPGQRVSIADPDFYSVVVPPGQLLTLVTTATSAVGLYTLRSWNVSAGCDGIYAGAVTVFGMNPGGLALINNTASPQTYAVEVRPSPDQATQSGFCFSYDLELVDDLGGCEPWETDPFEPNDSCTQAAPILGEALGLGMRKNENDWYSVSIPAHSTLRVRSTPYGAGEVRNMQLYNGCGGVPDYLTSSAPLDFAPLESRQWLEWTNPGSSPLDSLLTLWRNVQFPTPFCTEYDLQVSLTLGEPFCIGKRNSTGEAARLEASGSLEVGSGSLSVAMGPVPANNFGLLFFGPAQQAPSVLGKGYLCIAGPLVRFAPASTGTGTLVTEIDWSAPGPAAVIQVGQEWYFQGWYRDPHLPGPSFNFSEGLRLSFF